MQNTCFAPECLIKVQQTFFYRRSGKQHTVQMTRNIQLDVFVPNHPDQRLSGVKGWSRSLVGTNLWVNKSFKSSCSRSLRLGRVLECVMSLLIVFCDWVCRGVFWYNRSRNTRLSVCVWVDDWSGWCKGGEGQSKTGVQPLDKLLLDLTNLTNEDIQRCVAVTLTHKQTHNSARNFSTHTHQQIYDVIILSRRSMTFLCDCRLHVNNVFWLLM